MGSAVAGIVLSFLQASTALGINAASRHQPLVFDGGQGCAELANKGTHFTIDVEVGTPAQRFAAVADTGSNTLIVPSCLCQERGRCPKEDHCFTGTNKSSSFKLTESGEQGPPSLVLSFGSGQIQGVVAKDTVKVGQIECFLEDGLLLMTDRALNIQGPFEGILGLGVPQAEASTTTVAQADAPQQESIQDIIQKIMGGGMHSGQQPAEGAKSEDSSAALEDSMRKILGLSSAGTTNGSMEVASIQGPPAGGFGSLEDVMRRAMSNKTKASRGSPKGFLEQAKIERFSVCFNDGSNGVLRLGTSAPPMAHGGVGRQHWGVDFRGISVGKSDKPAQALFCHPGNLSQGQQTPCGAIPDSGTTVLMGPAEHVSALMEEICDNWERCRSNYTALQAATSAASDAMTRIYGYNPFNLKSSMEKVDVLQALMLDCESWMDEEGLAELPPLHFHMAGSSGTQQTLTLPGHLYVIESPKELMTNWQLFGKGDIPIVNSSAGSSGKVCTTALGTMEYNTKLNGPVWILGTPLFYQFVVGYDIGTDPPSIAFSRQAETPCGSCDTKVELFSNSGHSGAAAARPAPIRVDGPPRMPRVDTSQPL